LPVAQRGIFRDLQKLVDDRQYRRAVKDADAILKVVPHGPTTALKALAVLNLGRKEEALELAKAALKLSIR